MTSRRLAIGLVALGLLACGAAAAQERDRVTVKYFPGDRGPGTYEPMELQFERFRGVGPDRKPDRFFDEIPRILSSHGIASSWQYVYPDGAFIRIQVEIGGQRIELASAHTIHERGGRHIALERGLQALEGRDPKPLLAKESAAFRNRRLAFEQILALVAARVRENLQQ